ncbi:hypothetical protein, partial [Lentimicrobium sp. S6]
MNIKSLLFTVALFAFLATNGYSDIEKSLDDPPILNHYSHIIDDSNGSSDNDGKAEGGESINMPVNISNSGESVATDVSAILSCTHPSITITDANESYPDIPIGANRQTDYDYDFIVATGILVQFNVTFTLDITSNEGTWTDTFIVTIYPDNASPMPVLEYQAHNFFEAGADDDDLAEGGESIRMPIELLNSGEARATVVSAVISTNDPAITLTDASENYPHIEAGYDEWSNYNYNFDIAPGITQTRTVEFNIEMTSNQGTWTDVFTIEIHPDNIVYMPELAYAA